jgi:hypothetical protein
MPCEALFRTTGGREGHTHEAFDHIAPALSAPKAGRDKNSWLFRDRPKVLKQVLLQTNCVKRDVQLRGPSRYMRYIRSYAK